MGVFTHEDQESSKLPKIPSTISFDGKVGSDLEHFLVEVDEILAIYTWPDNKKCIALHGCLSAGVMVMLRRHPNYVSGNYEV